MESQWELYNPDQNPRQINLKYIEKIICLSSEDVFKGRNVDFRTVIDAKPTHCLLI